MPDVLRSGNHAAIARWRRDRALERTAARRPDLLAALPADALDAPTGPWPRSADPDRRRADFTRPGAVWHYGRVASAAMSIGPRRPDPRVERRPA